MKSGKSLIFCAALAIGSMSSDAVCQSAEATDSTIRAVCFIPFRDSDIGDQLEAGLSEAEAEAENLTLSVYYYSDFPEMDFSVYTDMALAMNADYLISFGGPAKDEYPEAMEKLRNAHTRLVVLDHDTENPEDRAVFVGSDNGAAGQELMEYVRKNIESPGIAIFYTHYHGGMIQRLEEIEQVTNDNPAMELLVTKQLSQNDFTAQKEISDVLDTEPGINAVICIDATSSDNAARAFADRADAPGLFCFDCDSEVEKALKTGVVDVTMVQDYREMGRACIRAILEYDRDEKPLEVYTECLAVEGAKKEE